MSKTLELAIDVIKEFEGFEPNAYPDPLSGGKPWTIGYGATKRNGAEVRRGDKITEAEASDLLILQLENDYLPPLNRISGFDQFHPGQQACLLSFAYNVGANFYGSNGFATITRCLHEKRYGDVPNALRLYVNPGTKVEAGLRRRREAEIKLWESAYSEQPAEILDMFRFFKPDLPGQESAAKYIQSCLTLAERIEATKLYRNNPAPPEQPESEQSYWLYSRLTGRWVDWNGVKMRQLQTHLMRGEDSIASVFGVSGHAYAQDLVHPSRDYSGSMRICPENIYSLGLDDLGYTPDRSDGIGRFAITMAPQFKINNRSGLWHHADWNRATKPGSAGCLVYTDADFEKVLGWYRQFKPDYQAVDLGQGFLESKGYEIPRL